MNKKIELEGLDRRVFLRGAAVVAGALVLPHLEAQSGPPTGTITTILGGGALRNGSPAAQVAISSPFGVAVDSQDNIYICDNYYHRIYKVAAGTTLFTTVAGSGVPGFSGDKGPATSAAFNYPYGVAVDSSGKIYIADADNNRVRRVDQSTGVINTLTGTSTPGYNGDGIPAAGAEIYKPHGVGVDAAGNVYIADSGNNRVRVVNLGTKPLMLYPQSSTPITVNPGNIATACGNGTGGFTGDGGPAIACNLNMPWGVGFDRLGNMFVADYYNQRVRMVNAATGIITTVAGTGVVGSNGDGGLATAAAISFPCSVAFDSGNNLFIGQEQISTIRKVSASTQIISTVAGKGGFGCNGDGGPAINAQLSSPTGVCIDSMDNLYAADYNNARVRLITASTQVITTYTGSTNVGNGGPALQALLNEPCGFSIGAQNQLILADEDTNEVRLLDTNQMVRLIAGTGFAGYNGDGIAATTAQLNLPSDAQHDAQGNLYICDRLNARIRRVDAKTGLISTVAGNGISGYGGDGGPATSAELNTPRAIILDALGNLYISELNGLRVRYVNLGTTPAVLYAGSANQLTIQPGVIITVAGNGKDGSTGDGGPAVNCTLNEPRGVTTDSLGNVYITEGGRDPQNLPGPGILPDCKVRKIDATTGIITTVAGTDTPGYNGDGIPATQAELNGPRNVAVDRFGNIYIADSLNNRIRYVDAQTGIINTVVGNTGHVGFSGDGGPAATALLCTPRFVGLDSAGNLYITDVGNSRVRKVVFN